jgi:hypothetical protein
MEHGDNGPKMDGEYDVVSLDPSLAESFSSQLSHAEKVDVMGGGFRLQPPHERFDERQSNPMPKQPPQTKPLMRKGSAPSNSLVMKQKIQREGVGRLQPMLPVPSGNQSVSGIRTPFINSPQITCACH